jgi:hypothetical protein
MTFSFAHDLIIFEHVSLTHFVLELTEKPKESVTRSMPLLVQREARTPCQPSPPSVNVPLTQYVTLTQRKHPVSLVPATELHLSPSSVYVPQCATGLNSAELSIVLGKRPGEPVDAATPKRLRTVVPGATGKPYFAASANLKPEQVHQLKSSKSPNALLKSVRVDVDQQPVQLPKLNVSSSGARVISLDQLGSFAGPQVLRTAGGALVGVGAEQTVTSGLLLVKLPPVLCFFIFQPFVSSCFLYFSASVIVVVPYRA